MREALREVDYQVEAEQFLVVDGVPLDVNAELTYEAVSKGFINKYFRDAPGGISLGKSTVCSIRYLPF